MSGRTKTNSLFWKRNRSGIQSKRARLLLRANSVLFSSETFPFELLNPGARRQLLIVVKRALDGAFFFLGFSKCEMRFLSGAWDWKRKVIKKEEAMAPLVIWSDDTQPYKSGVCSSWLGVGQGWWWWWWQGVCGWQKVLVGGWCHLFVCVCEQERDLVLRLGLGAVDYVDHESLRKDRSPGMCVSMESKLWHVDCRVMPADSSYKDITCHSNWRHPIGVLVWLTRQQAGLILEGFQSGHRCHATATVNHARRNKNISAAGQPRGRGRGRRGHRGEQSKRSGLQPEVICRFST